MAGDGEEKPKPKREYTMPSLPLPDKPQRVFDLDAQRAALFDEEDVMRSVIVLMIGMMSVVGCGRDKDKDNKNPLSSSGIEILVSPRVILDT